MTAFFDYFCGFVCKGCELESAYRKQPVHESNAAQNIASSVGRGISAAPAFYCRLTAY